jgi:hypothetical protein
LSTLEQDLAEALTKGDEQAAGRVLDRFAEAVAKSALLTAGQGVALEVRLGTFALQGENLRYVSSDIRLGTALPSLGDAIVKAADAAARFPEVAERYLDRVAEALRQQLTSEELASLDIPSTFANVPPESSTRARAKARLLDTLTSA